MKPPTDFAAAREAMIRSQLQPRGISDTRVLRAMARVPREAFVLETSRQLAYDDEAMEIDCRQTISQPYIVALMSQAARIQPAHRVLEIGTGSGYQTAVLAEMGVEIHSVERHAELSRKAFERLEALDYEKFHLHVGDGTLGWPEEAPYDRILVTAAAERPPASLISQLADGGILVIPVGGTSSQVLQAIHRRGDDIDIKELIPCRFVPLIGVEGWPLG